jgi:hypothetical protein
MLDEAAQGNVPASRWDSPDALPFVHRAYAEARGPPIRPAAEVRG